MREKSLGFKTEFTPKQMTLQLSSFGLDDTSYATDSSSSGGGWSTGLTSLLNTVGQLGSAAILSSNNNSPQYYPPVNGYQQYGTPLTSPGGSSSLLLIGIVALVGYFAFRSMKA